MHTFKESMTSKERVVAALTGQPYDRIPVFMLLSDQAARTIGVTVREYQKSARLMARGQLTAWRSYGMDMINTGPGLTGIAEAAGKVLGILGITMLWDAFELTRQQKRVREIDIE